MDNAEAFESGRLRVEAIFLAIFPPLAKFPPQSCALLM